MSRTIRRGGQAGARVRRFHCVVARGAREQLSEATLPGVDALSGARSRGRALRGAPYGARSADRSLWGALCRSHPTERAPRGAPQEKIKSGLHRG